MAEREQLRAEVERLDMSLSTTIAQHHQATLDQEARCHDLEADLQQTRHRMTKMMTTMTTMTTTETNLRLELEQLEQERVVRAERAAQEELEKALQTSQSDQQRLVAAEDAERRIALAEKKVETFRAHVGVLEEENLRWKQDLERGRRDVEKAEAYRGRLRGRVWVRVRVRGVDACRRV